MNTLTAPRRHVDPPAEAHSALTPKEREQLNDLRVQLGHQMNGTEFTDESEELEVYWQLLERSYAHQVERTGITTRENLLHWVKMLDHHLIDD